MELKIERIIEVSDIILTDSKVGIEVMRLPGNRLQGKQKEYGALGKDALLFREMKKSDIRVLIDNEESRTSRNGRALKWKVKRPL